VTHDPYTLPEELDDELTDNMPPEAERFIRSRRSHRATASELFRRAAASRGDPIGPSAT
jgi:hypothetical protein